MHIFNIAVDKDIEYSHGLYMSIGHFFKVFALLKCHTKKSPK